MTHMNDDRNTTNQGENGPIETHGPTCGSCTQIGKSEETAEVDTKGGDRCAERVPWGPYRLTACVRPVGHKGAHRAHPAHRRGSETIEWGTPERMRAGVGR